MSYRPWGLLDWTLRLSSSKQWLFVGTLGTEVRSLAAWRALRAAGAEAEHSLLEIHDTKSHFTRESKARLTERWAEFSAGGGRAERVYRNLGLLDELHRIDTLGRSFCDAGRPVLLDITSLPKRYFFPILRRLCNAPGVRDLVVTYTSPEDYPHDGRPMSEGAGTWTHLPGFLPSTANKPELLIAGAGFATQNLQSHIRSITHHKAIKILIPFPAPLATLNRTWQAVYQLEGELPPGKFENYRVPANDISATFDRILSLVRDTDAEPAFAPFGPKPISAAMCLFAALKPTAIYYPQPSAYHPSYSTGIGKVDGKDAVFAYWIKHDGELLYRNV